MREAPARVNESFDGVPRKGSSFPQDSSGLFWLWLVADPFPIVFPIPNPTSRHRVTSRPAASHPTAKSQTGGPPAVTT